MESRTSMTRRSKPPSRRSGRTYHSQITELAEDTAALPPLLRGQAIALVRGVVALLARLLQGSG